MDEIEEILGLDVMLDHQPAQCRAVFVEHRLLDEPRFGLVDVEQLRHEGADPDVDLVEQPAARRIERVVEIEHPGVDMGEAAAHSPVRDTRVPTPCGVKSSSSTECGTRPSSTMTPSTPDSTTPAAAFDLGDHAAGDRAIGDERRDVGERQLADELLVLVEHARHIGEEQEPLGLHGGGDGAGRRVGIDIVGLAIVADADRRDDRDRVAVDDRVEDLDIDPVRLADEAELDRLGLAGHGIGLLLGEALGDQEIAVLAGNADRAAARLLDRGDDRFVDRAGEHHLDDFHRLLVGDAQALAELRLDCELVEHAVDLRAAAMHDHRVECRTI